MLLTVITINYNNASGLERTLQSVFAQTFKGFEYIVIDGGSTDGSKALIEKNAANINYWVSEPDKGIYNAMNKGLKAAKGEYVCFLNSGDTFYNDAYLKQVSEQHISTFDILYGDLLLIDNKFDYNKTFPKHLSNLFFFQDSIPHPATWIRKSLFDSIGYYDENLKIVADWKWFFIAIGKCQATYKHTGVIAAKFYLDGVSSNQNHHSKLITEREAVIDECFPHINDLYWEIQTLEKKYAHIRTSLVVKMLFKLGLLKDKHINKQHG